MVIIPLAALRSALFVACLDLKGLWETFVVERWEWLMVDMLPSPPALNLKGKEATFGDIVLGDSRGAKRVESKTVK